jgi:hypothetical protein
MLELIVVKSLNNEGNMSILDRWTPEAVCEILDIPRLLEDKLKLLYDDSNWQNHLTENEKITLDNACHAYESIGY